MSKFTIYHWKYNGSTRVCIVPNHYCRTLAYIKETLELAKTWGLTIPKDKDIQFEVLSGDRHKGMLSIEFNSKTEPNFDTKNVHFTDTDKYPHCQRNICTP